MTARKITTATLLVLLLGILAAIIYTRGFGAHLGAKAAGLDAPFTTEEAWIVDEIVRDITEMSAYPDKPPATTIEQVRPDRGIYRVTIGDAEPCELDLRNDLWSPAAFANLARNRFGTTAAVAASAPPAPVYPSLVDLTAVSLVSADGAISKRLASSMRDVAAHEAAAVILAGFALREAAGRMGDTRWAMNRMTAHLAIATALRGDGAPGIDARLADATLLTLTDRQTRAIAILDSLESRRSRDAAVSAWTRALRMRITDDWRLLPDPSHATRLEQREYFRARRAAIRLSRGTETLEQMGVAPDADWVRIINSYSVAVEDGWLVTEALDLERAEYEDVFRRMHGRAMDKSPISALNTPASRCVASDAVHVLPWGAWAEFEQRHLSVVIGRYDSFFRHSLGAGDRADTQKIALKRRLGDLWIFPASTLWWTKGPHGLEGDGRYLNEIVDQVLSAPHRVTATTWTYLNMATKYEPVRRDAPPSGAWFFKPEPRTAYEAGTRLNQLGHSSVTDIAAILEGAPYDLVLASEYLRTKYGQKAPIEEIDRLLGRHMDYDPRAIDWALSVLPDGDRRIGLLRASCRIAAGACTDLGYELARLGRDDQAAQVYEKAFADRTLDEIAVANKSGWLIRYYASHDRVGPALKLAERVAGTGAFQGLAGAAHLYERLGRTDDAEDMYRQSAQSYDDYSELLGFYYRAVELRKKREYESAWTAARDQIFPNGLTNSPLSDDKPAVGIHVASDSAPARTLGLQAGDIIVAVDGWHVTNVPQYRAVRAFPETGPFTLTVWRGHLKNVQIADRAFVPEFRIENYPVQGWIER